VLSRQYEHLRFDLLSPLNIPGIRRPNAAEKRGRAEDDMAQNVVVESMQPQTVAKSQSYLSFLIWYAMFLAEVLPLTVYLLGCQSQ